MRVSSSLLQPEAPSSPTSSSRWRVYGRFGRLGVRPTLRRSSTRRWTLTRPPGSTTWPRCDGFSSAVTWSSSCSSPPLPSSPWEPTVSDELMTGCVWICVNVLWFAFSPCCREVQVCLVTSLLDRVNGSTEPFPDVLSVLSVEQFSRFLRNLKDMAIKF